MTSPDLAAIDPAIIAAQIECGLIGKAHYCLMQTQSAHTDPILTKLIVRLAEVGREWEAKLLRLGSQRSRVAEDSAKTIAAYDAMRAKLTGKGASHAK